MHMQNNNQPHKTSLMRYNIQKQLNGADYDKLSYLVSLLNTKEAFRQQRAELIGKLRKKDSVT